MYYRIMRRVLILTVLLVAYLAALVIYLVPYGWLMAAGIAVFMLFRKTYRYTAYGSAYWASAEHLEDLTNE